MSWFAIPGKAGILLVDPSGNNIDPKGISLIAAPIVAVSFIITSAKLTESSVWVCLSAIASMLTRVSNEVLINSSS